MKISANSLFFIGPYETLNPETETSLLLMQELLNRDQQFFGYHKKTLHCSLISLQVECFRLQVPGGDQV